MPDETPAPKPSIEQVKAMLLKPHIMSDLLRAYLLNILRQVCVHLYVQARALDEFSQQAQERKDSLGEAAGLISLIAGAAGYFSFADFQRIAATNYAVALFLQVDSAVQQLRKLLLSDDWSLEFGPIYAGHPLTEIIHATTAQIRHAHNWDKEEPQDDGRVLADIGIADITSDRVPLEVLRLVGRSQYFEFEDDLREILSSLIEKAKQRTQESPDSGTP